MSEIPEAVVQRAANVVYRETDRVMFSPATVARAVLTATWPQLRRHIAADIAAGLEDGCCPYCTVGEHALCTRGGCVCWTEAGTHRQDGGVG